MKRLVCVFLCAAIITALLAGCAGNRLPQNQPRKVDKTKIDKSVVQGNTKFAFDILKQLNNEDKDRNIFISPLSISTALTMTYQGAGSATKAAMAATLGYDGIDSEQINESYRNLMGSLIQSDKKIEVNMSNSIWTREGKKIKDEFLSVNKNIFDAYINALDFSQKESADRINKWISDSTKGKINKMIEPPIPGDTIMYLINAIYFKGEWTKSFDKKRTFSTRFHSDSRADGEVMMMNRNGKAEYGQGEDFKAVRLPYGKGKTAMYCVLPSEDIPLNDFLKDMGPDKWEKIKESISEMDEVTLQIPRFKMEYGIKELNQSLTALGMGEAFGSKADFSGISDGVAISRVLHKAVIEANEEGSEAAAATVVEMKEVAAMVPAAFIADRPFMFVIADDETGTILFMGKLYNI